MTDRRDNWPPNTDSEFWARLDKHIALEEEREKQDEARFKAGAARMQEIEKDLRPLKQLYWAVIGSGGVAALLLGTLLFIYRSDKADLKAMQEILYKQGTAIELLIKSHQELEKDMRREVSRVDRDIERFHNHK
jgi:hypothetical protein